MPRSLRSVTPRRRLPWLLPARRERRGSGSIKAGCVSTHRTAPSRARAGPGRMPPGGRVSGSAPISLQRRHLSSRRRSPGQQIHRRSGVGGRYPGGSPSGGAYSLEGRGGDHTQRVLRADEPLLQVVLSPCAACPVGQARRRRPAPLQAECQVARVAVAQQSLLRHPRCGHLTHRSTRGAASAPAI